MQKLITGIFSFFVLTGLSLADNGWGLFGAYWNAGDADDAIGAGAKIDIALNENIQLELRGTYFDDLIDGGGADADLEVIPLEAGLTFAIPTTGALGLYAGGGLGYYLMDGDIALSDGTGLDADPDNELGFYLVTGLEFKLSESGMHWGGTDSVLFAELMYRAVNVDEIDVSGSGSSLKLDDVDLDGVGVNVGLMVKW